MTPVAALHRACRRRHAVHRLSSAVTLCGAMGLLACNPADRGRDAGPQTTIVIGVEAAATTVLPPLASSALDFEIAGALYLGLNFGEWRDGGLSYIPGHPLGLARDWTLDGADLTYHLDTGRRWSDGAPIRAADIRFTYELLADTLLDLPLSSVTSRIDSISIPDDSTAVFHFRGEYAGMLFDTGVGVLPEHFFVGVSRDRLRGGLPLPAGQRPTDMPVSGAFKLVEWLPEERIVLARNDHAEKPGQLDRVVIRVVPEETTRAAELRSGELAAAGFNSFRVARTVENAGARLLAIPQRGYDYIAWYPGAHVALANRSVRKALSLAIDRESLIGALDLTGFAEPAWGPYGSLFESLRSAPPHQPLYDPVVARALLEAAGWVDADGDGVRERGDERLAFDLAVPAGNDRREDAAEIIQSQLAAVGVGIRIRPAEFNALFGRLMAGEYQAALMGWQVALDPDVSVFWADPLSPLNVVEFDDAAVSASIEAALGQRDADAAEPYWRAAAEGVAAQYPYAFLWYFDIPFAVDASIEGVRVDATGWGTGLADWRVERATP